MSVATRFCCDEMKYPQVAWFAFMRSWLVWCCTQFGTYANSQLSNVGRVSNPTCGLKPDLQGVANKRRQECNTTLAVLAVMSTLGGCATYSGSFGVIERNLATQQYDSALKNIEKEKDSKTDRVLYFLNKGMVLRMKRDFAASNEALEAAKAEMDRLYAASVSENVLSVMVNDSTVSYSGDNFERVLLHLYMALNYLELGQPDSARIEALQLDAKLREFAEKVPESKHGEDAFTLYLTGMIYEDRGERSDAMISYRSAYNVYKKYQANYALSMPSMLKTDLMRMARQQGLTDELEKYKNEFGLELPANKAADSGELVFVLNNGLAPIKREKAINSFDATTASMVRIALPAYESRRNNIVAARVIVNDSQTVTELMEDIDAIAKKNLDSHMPAIVARSVARVVVKAASNKKVRQAALNNKNNDNAMAGALGALAFQVATIATERADTRSWLTLPANIQMGRLSLPAGSYNVKVELLGANHQVVATQDYPGIVIKKSHKTFLTKHWSSN